MAIAVIMPKQGQTVETCILTKWFKNKGDRVSFGDLLFSFETDKAAFDLESPAEGILLDQFFYEGDEVPILVNVGVIGKSGEETATFNPHLPASSATNPQENQPSTEDQDPGIIQASPDSKIRISPKAKRIAGEKGLNYNILQGSGPDGRIVVRDIEKVLSGTAPGKATVKFTGVEYTEQTLSKMKVDLRNKVVIITGATSGIGRGIALIFAENGATVVINGIDEEGGNKVVEEIRTKGGRAIFFKADVGDADQAIAMADKTVEEFGKIDILINNAGINIGLKQRGPIQEFPDDMWKKILNVNLDGVYYCSKAVLRNMTHNGYGKIINVSSVVGVVPLRNQCAFAAAKAGVIQLTKAMAIELASFGVNVNVICPGSIQIPKMTEADGMYADNRFESIMSHIPMKRPGTPQDIGYAALYLASEQANYVTGAVHIVDGGWTSGFARDW